MTTTDETTTEVRYEYATSSEQFVTLDPEVQGMHGVWTGDSEYTYPKGWSPVRQKQLDYEKKYNKLNRAVLDREGVLEYLNSKYGPESGAIPGSFKVREVTTTTHIVHSRTEDADGNLTEDRQEHVTTTAEVFHIFKRAFEDWKRFTYAPRQEMREQQETWRIKDETKRAAEQEAREANRSFNALVDGTNKQADKASSESRKFVMEPIIITR